MAAPQLNLDLSGIALGQARVPDPIANALATIQSTVNNLGNAHLASDANVDLTKLATGVLRASSFLTFSGCQLFKSANEAYATGAFRDLLFDSEDFDTDGYHATGANTQRITNPFSATAYFYVHAAIQWANNATGIRAVQIERYNSSAVLQQTYAKHSHAATDQGTANNYQQTGAIVKMNSGDFLIVRIFQDSGGNLNIQGGDTTATSVACIKLGR